MKLFLLLLLLSITAHATNRVRDNKILLGIGTLTNVDYAVDVDGSDEPKIRYNATLNKWTFSQDGVTFEDFVGLGYVDAAVAGVTIPDATTLVKGKVQLAGDLGGTAALPTVPGLALKAPLASPALTGTPTAPTQSPGDNSTKIATTAYADAAVASATIPDATTLIKGKVQLAGDLGGTAALPTVPGLANKVTGPASATDNAVPRYDSTTGKLVQGSNVIISDSDALTGVSSLLSTGNITSQNGNVEAERFIEEVTTDSTTSGANAFVPSGTGIIRLTNASLTSIAAIDDTTDGRSVTLINGLTTPITIVNNGGATVDAYKILTGSENISLVSKSSITLKYSSGESRWIISGGGGGAYCSGSATCDIFSFTYGTTNGVTVCNASPCSYLDQIGSNVSSLDRSSAGTYLANLTKTYSKLKCVGNTRSGSTFFLTDVPACSSCNSINVYTLAQSTGTGTDSYGTINCVGIP